MRASLLTANRAASSLKSFWSKAAEVGQRRN